MQLAGVGDARVIYKEGTELRIITVSSPCCSSLLFSLYLFSCYIFLKEIPVLLYYRFILNFSVFPDVLRVC